VDRWTTGVADRATQHRLKVEREEQARFEGNTIDICLILWENVQESGWGNWECFVE
jgi:hypothetical protein